MMIIGLRGSVQRDKVLKLFGQPKTEIKEGFHIDSQRRLIWIARQIEFRWCYFTFDHGQVLAEVNSSAIPAIIDNVSFWDTVAKNG